MLLRELSITTKNGFHLSRDASQSYPGSYSDASLLGWELAASATWGDPCLPVLRVSLDRGFIETIGFVKVSKTWSWYHYHRLKRLFVHCAPNRPRATLDSRSSYAYFKPAFFRKITSFCLLESSPWDTNWPGNFSMWDHDWVLPNQLHHHMLRYLRPNRKQIMACISMYQVTSVDQWQCPTGTKLENKPGKFDS